MKQLPQAFKLAAVILYCLPDSLYGLTVLKVILLAKKDTLCYDTIKLGKGDQLMEFYANLHLHSTHSDGVYSPAELVRIAKEEGYKALAITDHGNMFGVVEFYKACKEEGVKPIIGCEVYVASRSRFDKVHGIDSNRHHLVFYFSIVQVHRQRERRD